MLRASLLLATTLLLAGCSDPGPERASISGSITLDGKPVEQGSITFVPTEGTSGPTAGDVISGGQYEIPRALGPLVGKNKVELRSWRLTGRQIPNPMSPGSTMEERVEAFPAQFNNETTLVREITAGHNSLDFDLKSDRTSP